jgi:hypothetical protein
MSLRVRDIQVVVSNPAVAGSILMPTMSERECMTSSAGDMQGGLPTEASE